MSRSLLCFVALVLSACASPMTTRQHDHMQSDVQSLADEVAVDLSEFAPAKAVETASYVDDEHYVGSAFVFVPTPTLKSFAPDHFNALVQTAATRWCLAHGYSKPQQDFDHPGTIQLSTRRGRVQLSVRGTALMDPFAHPTTTECELTIHIHHA